MANNENKDNLLGWLYETRNGFRVTVTEEMIQKLSSIPVGSSMWVSRIGEEARKASAERFGKELSKTSAATLSFSAPQEQQAARPAAINNAAKPAVANKPVIKAAPKVERF